MNTNHFDLSVVQDALPEYCRFVISQNKRIVIKLRGDERCVIISQKELESLEKALEILCESSSVVDLCDKIRQLCEKDTDNLEPPAVKAVEV